MDWHVNDTSTTPKSLPHLKSLVSNIITRPGFDPKAFEGFSAEREQARIDNLHNNPASVIRVQDPWTAASPLIPLCPPTTVTYPNVSSLPSFPVDGMYHRTILGLIKSALSEPAAEQFHLFPFEQYWQPSSGPPQRIYSEVYTSPAFLDEHRAIRESLLAKGITAESVVVGLTMWSDSTHLTQFGSASLWPVYVGFANQSKYTRGKPSTFSSHHLAYIPKLGATFEQVYFDVFNEAPTRESITQARRELVHAVWLVLLDDKFVHAYVYGFDWVYWDNITRRTFPRIFTHAMDYQEKVLLACIKFLAFCPCPRCLIRKAQIPMLGTAADDHIRATQPRFDNEQDQYDIKSIRKQVYLKGVSLASKTVKAVLGRKSWTPIRSAFSSRLFEHGFDYLKVIVPDLLHEFELGVWKAIFIHLIRILTAYNSEKVIELNRR
ncbi:hypothetical protein DFP72DRAFT_829097 [Ephemerocybe angulata]|uniref:Uncharacterized protein n=1 Tax=Ephemerocybe angulata TaxID=980116 RepID=A0A8H6LTC5_9AGAR|nr:hypothetical protein DFP72DRAFT_829097 [Tulosesus angulatus]